MTTLGGTAVTLLDILKTLDPKGMQAKIIEILDQINDMYSDAIWRECNDGDSHQTTIATGLPHGTWRRYNEGIQPTKGTNAQARVQTGMLEDTSVVDKALAEKSGNIAGFRTDEIIKHIEGMSQDLATALVYEDERTNPSRFTGLQAHYSTVDTAVAASAENVIDGAGTTTDNLSIYFVTWAPNGTFCVYPKGASAGIKHEYLGESVIQDATGITGSVLRGLRDWFECKIGLCVADWRRNVRIANIDVANLRAQSNDADIHRLLIQADEMIPASAFGKKAIYCNATARTWMRIQAQEKAAYQITLETIGGKQVTMWNGIPVRRCDAMLNTEDRVV